jgi:23S rRNA pseudouridine1911/1915/1917 synthase
MGASHPSRAERLQVGKDGTPVWYRPPGMKTKYDFPRAKEGERDRIEFNVGDRHPGKPRRLDKYLQERFPGYSRSFLQKMIKDEKVLLNGKSTKSSWHVTTGEQITMLLHPAGAKVAEDIPFDVVHRDEHILSIVKPSGVIVHPARGHKTGTLYNGLLHYFREERAADPSFHIGTVHRLDEETSGVMIYALCLKAHKSLTHQFEGRTVKKTYLCLAHGAPDFVEKTVDAPLGTDAENRYKVAVNGLDAKTAQTRFVTLAVAKSREFSLLRAYPLTGRTHQIRVHAAHLGHALAGDPLYGGVKEHDAFGGMIARVCLHAESLSINHPATGAPMTLCAPLPPDYTALMTQLGFEPVGGAPIILPSTPPPEN